jgi:hypothetical protein
MSSAKAILAGAALIAVSILLVNAIHPAVAMSEGGPYQLMHHSNTTANAGVFKLDTASGEVSYCYISGNGGAEISCSRAAR